MGDEGVIMNDKENAKIFDKVSEHLLNDEFPSHYIASLSMDSCCDKYPFSLLWKLKITEQSPIHHPEGNVWNHTMLVLDEAAKVRNQCKNPRAFMWAALLHDIGKPGTTRVRKGKITSYDHDKEGEKISAEFLRYFTQDECFIEQVTALVRYHMHMLYVLKELPYSDVDNLLLRVDKEDMALLCRCDRLGRTGADVEAEEVEYSEFLDKLQQYSK